MKKRVGADLWHADGKSVELRAARQRTAEEKLAGRPPINWKAVEARGQTEFIAILRQKYLLRTKDHLRARLTTLIMDYAGNHPQARLKLLCVVSAPWRWRLPRIRGLWDRQQIQVDFA